MCNDGVPLLTCISSEWSSRMSCDPQIRISIMVLQRYMQAKKYKVTEIVVKAQPPIVCTHVASATASTVEGTAEQVENATLEIPE